MSESPISSIRIKMSDHDYGSPEIKKQTGREDNALGRLHAFKGLKRLLPTVLQQICTGLAASAVEYITNEGNIRESIFT